MLKNLRSFLSILTIVFALPVGLFLVSQRANLRSNADGTNANLVIDLGAVSKVEVGNTNNLAQGGEETTPNTFTPVIENIKQIKPKYIRIDHVFDFYTSISQNQNIVNFNFEKLDTIIGDIRKTGAIPFLSLMPYSNNMNDWSTAVKNVIEHVSGSLGVSDVYYEIGNEPDLFGGWKTYGDKNYLNLYSSAISGANKAQNVKNFKIGGPATTALYENWFKEFLRLGDQNNLRIDFYSWHRYSTNFEDYEKDIINAHAWLEEFPKYSGIEFLITESGPDSNNNTIYDNNFSAIHSLALSTISGFDLQKLFHFEIKDGPGSQKLWGRWGILTHEKFGTPSKKPRFDSLLFANRLTGNEISVQGLGSWVKAKGVYDGSTYRILIVNYDPNGRHIEAVPLLFDRVPASFNYKRIDFAGQTTSKQIDTPQGSKSWSTTELLNPNSAIIIEIKP